MNKSGNKSLSVFKAIFRITPIVVKAAPITCLIYMLLSVFQGATWGLLAPFNQRLFDSLADLAVGIGEIRYVYIGVALVTLIVIMRQVTEAVTNFFGSHILYWKVRTKTTVFYHNKLTKLQTIEFENNESLDEIEKTNGGKQTCIAMYMNLNFAIFVNGAFFIVMGTFLWNIQPILLLSFVFVFAPVILSQMFEARLYAMLENASAPIRRQNEHYEDCLVGRVNTHQTRLFGAYGFFKKLYMDSLTMLAKKEWDTQKKVSAINLGLNTVKAAGWIGILVLLFRGLLMGYVSVGAFAAVFASVSSMFNMIDSMISSLKYSFVEKLPMIHNFINFIDMPLPEKKPGTPNFNKGIILEDVSFSYPKADKPVVDGVSITIRPGETLALVGENGSGKTTLVKLMCGLFKPGSGTVFVGGLNTAETDDKDMFSQTSAVFQDFARYQIALGENVQLSMIESGKSPETALGQADIDFGDTDTFPKGLDTILSREYDGVDLSGGQWQRVATARGLYRDHQFIVLDEPTSNIDPLEETRLYNRFAELAREKIAVIVTHRLGSARIAERIAVMDAGKIVEIGTHEELLDMDGLYAKMWSAQAESYNAG